MIYSKQTWTNGISKLNASRMQHIEDGIEALESGVIAKPSSPADGDALVWDSGSSTWKRATDKKVRVGALADPGTGKVIGSSGGAATAVYPPGYVFTYDQITANVTISATTEATATTIVTASAVTFDGSTVVYIEFSAVDVVVPANAAGNTVVLVLYQDGSSIGKIAFSGSTSNAEIEDPVRTSRRLTPSSGAHTYSIRGYRTNANGTVIAGAGGVGNSVPGYIKIVKE